MNCPKCGNNRVQKRGRRAGKQRYICPTCKACFTEGVPYKEPSPVDTSSVICPKCGSSNIVGDGKLSSGFQRYKCRNCNKGFSELTVSHFNKRYNCPYCGSSLNYSGQGVKGQPYYYCPSCKRSCSGDLNTKEPIKNPKFKEINTSVFCPECSSTNLRKMGHSRGKQKYVCYECGRVFMENTDFKFHSLRERKEVILEVFKGKSIKSVAKKYDYSERSIRSLVNPYYEKEKITSKQRNLILTYGYYFNVPAEYIAEYVPCSLKLCKKVIKDYSLSISETLEEKEKVTSTILGATLRSLSKTYRSSSVQNR